MSDLIRIAYCASRHDQLSSVSMTKKNEPLFRSTHHPSQLENHVGNMCKKGPLPHACHLGLVSQHAHHKATYVRPMSRCIMLREASSQHRGYETTLSSTPPAILIYVTPTQFADHAIEYKKKSRPPSSS